MGKMLRLTDEEEELLRKKAVEINKALINKGMQPVKDSELAHAVLKQAIRSAYVVDGKIRTTGEDN